MNFLECVIFFKSYFNIWIVIAQLYLLFVFGTKFPVNKSWQLKLITSVWNMALSIFSGFGLYYLSVFTYKCIVEEGPLSIFSQDKLDFRKDDIVWMWTFYFIVSKIPELIDTVLIKVSGKEPVFLQWFHHVVTMLYAYYLGVTYEASHLGLLFAVMNYGVHTVMYFYFAIQPYLDRSNIIVKYSFVITILQTLQMFIALFGYFYCHFVLDKPFDWFGFTMYSIYAILFAQLLFTKVGKSKSD